MRDAQIKSYHVWGSVSRGGMSEVWLARHTDLAIPVVIKTLHTSVDREFEVRYARLLQEARLAARLTSPRIVRVVDVGVYTPPETDAESLPYLVEEYVDGVDLSEFEQQRREVHKRPLPLWLVTDVLAQSAEGLHAAHQGGVVHCDVKPSNLFGHGHARVKVGDFGVAVAASSATANPAGTPGFMAPEQWLGESIDRRADVYALGATGFFLRYGRLPFASSVESLRADAVPVFPPAITPEEAFFQHVLSRMLARRVDARFSGMTQPWAQLASLAQATRPTVRHVRTGARTFEMGPAQITFCVGDLTDCDVDAIVNSANSDLSMRASLADAIRLAGGDTIEREAMALGPRALGDCVQTSAGTLRARAVLHAVGGWQEVSCVARATSRALWLAERAGFTSIGLPAIATGTHGVPIEASADAMVSALRIHLSLAGSTLRHVNFVFPSEEKLRRFMDVAAAILLGSHESERYDDQHDAPVDGAHGAQDSTLFAVSPRISSHPQVISPTPARTRNNG
ncbi:MAG: serine/threonine-protein kinase [Deltaproteobacteria bacterium]|nr:serine/threonine-protein kinase [Deltaproteobacteria bacterium]